MAVTIVPYSEKHVAAVKAFNQRLQAGGAPSDYVFSESPVSSWLPKVHAAPVYNEFYLAVEDAAVRGTYAVKYQQFSFGGETRPVAYYHHPLSEGLVEKRFAHVGLQMLMNVVRANPMIYALGMGGLERPLPRMLAALKWRLYTVPFYFLVNRPANFLRELQRLRQSRLRRLAMDVAAGTGVGWLALKAGHAAKCRLRGWQPAAEVVSEFDDWADDVWEECQALYAMVAVRDGVSLRTLYPASNQNVIRLRVSVGSSAAWAVVADTQKREHPEYGNLRVGTILDGLARPGDAPAVIAAATRLLVDRGVDVITSNQSHAAWSRALDACGYFSGPSNFIFAASRMLSEWLQPFESTIVRTHFNRGDGDNLLQYC